jgi:hypothetical protein
MGRSGGLVGRGDAWGSLREQDEEGLMSTTIVASSSSYHCDPLSVLSTRLIRLDTG